VERERPLLHRRPKRICSAVKVAEIAEGCHAKSGITSDGISTVFRSRVRAISEATVRSSLRCALAQSADKAT